MAYEKKTAAEIISDMKVSLITNVDGINDANIGSVMDVLVTTLGEELEVQYNDLDVVYDSTRASTATGDDLEEIGSIVGIDRNEGEFSSGTVTYIRNSAAGSDFTLNQGTVISTQPSTEVEQYQFSIDNDTIFQASIEDEEHTFLDGVYEYKLDQRFIDDISTLTATVSSSSQDLTKNTDFSIQEDYSDIIIDTDTVTLMEDCETAGDWTAADSADAPTANTSEYYQGTQSLNLIKSSTATAIMSYNTTLSSTVDIDSNSVIWHIYINDSTTLNKISDIQIQYGSDSSNYNYIDYNVSELSTGWNKLVIDASLAETTTIGNPDDGNADYLNIVITLNNASDIITATNLMMDYIISSDYENYTGDIIKFDKSQTNPDNDTIFYVDYIPLSVEVDVTALDTGVDYNVQVGKVVYQISPNPNIDRIYNYQAFSGGIDVETDDDYRSRIISASDIVDKATVNAIEENVNSLSFIQSVTVDDLPEKTAPEEVITFSSATDVYTLLNQVPIDDVNLTIGNTTGSSDYTNGVDFELNDDGAIDWSIGGTNPTDGNDFYVNYHYNKLGYFDVNVVGVLGSLTTTQLTEVQNTVEEIKAAGTIGIVNEPSYISVNVEVTPTIDSSYNSNDVKDDIEVAITNYIEDRGIGEDILVAGIINNVMDVDGVQDLIVNDIGGGGSSNYTIGDNEVSETGVITVN